MAYTAHVGYYKQLHVQALVASHTAATTIGGTEPPTFSRNFLMVAKKFSMTVNQVFHGVTLKRGTAENTPYTKTQNSRKCPHTLKHGMAENTPIH